MTQHLHWSVWINICIYKCNDFVHQWNSPGKIFIYLFIPMFQNMKLDWILTTVEICVGLIYLSSSNPKILYIFLILKHNKVKLNQSYIWEFMFIIRPSYNFHNNYLCIVYFMVGSIYLMKYTCMRTSCVLKEHKEMCL